MKKNEADVPIENKKDNQIIKEELENCFISISNTQTEDEQTETLKSKYQEDISVNESESYGKFSSDRVSIEDSVELSVGKNFGKGKSLRLENNTQVCNQKLVARKNYTNKAEINSSDDKISETQFHKLEAITEEKQANNIQSYKASSAIGVTNTNNKSEKKDDSHNNPYLIYKKESSSHNQQINITNKQVTPINQYSNHRSISTDLSIKKPRITNKNTNSIINSINSIIHRTDKFPTHKQRIQITPVNSKEDSKKKNIDILQSLKEEISSLKQINFQYKKEKLEFEEEIAILKLEKQKLITIKDSQISTLNEKLSKYEIDLKQLNEINEYSKKRLDEFTPKVWKYDEIFEKYSKLCVENEKFLENNSTLNNLLNSTKKEKDEISQKFELHRMELEALKNDKFYLSKENLSLHEKLQNSEEKIKNLEEDIREIRKTNQKYIDQLTDKNLNIENSYQEKLKNELNEIKRNFEADKENLKKIYDDLAEKRVAYLTEERDELKMKNLRHEKVIKEKEEQTQFINDELRNLTKKTDEETSYLRIQLKIKSEDKERISNMYEENVNLIKILKNENESLKDKIDLLRTEMIKKESQFREEISKLKSHNQNIKEKLGSYEMIENELDKIIFDSAVMSNDENSDENEIISVIKDIPTSSKRRISQCLMLANKIKIMNVEIEKHKNMIGQLENELKLVNEEKEVYKNVAQKSKQPYQYLIKNLQDLELENHKKTQYIEDKDNTLKSLLRENEMLMEKIKGLQSDIKVILGNRQKIDSLEEIITRFVEKDKNFESKGKTNYNTPHSENDISTNAITRSNTNNNFNSMNFNRTNFNLCSNENLNLKNNHHQNQDHFYNGNSSIVIPERDMNRTNNEGSSSNMPRWYANLKSKKN